MTKTKEIDQFIKKIPDFNQLKSSEMIDYFTYYITIVTEKKYAYANDIKKCFTEAGLSPYSNISSYFSAKSRNKKPKFIKVGIGYILERFRKEEIERNLGTFSEHHPFDSLFPLELFENTRDYLTKIAKELTSCYELRFYDASLILIRKLLEILLIESFERYNRESDIKDGNGEFLYLEKLITKFTQASYWNLSRNTKRSLPQIKRLADICVHNRRFIAKKSDIDKIQSDLRVVLEEILHIIDYSRWN